MDAVKEFLADEVLGEKKTDLDLLADSVRQLHELRGANAQEEDPKTFGTISNSHAQRRQRKGPGPNAGGTASASASAAKPTLSDTPGPNSIWNKVNKASAKVEDKSATSSSKPTTMTEPTKPSSSITSSATSSAANAPPLLKRSGSSGGRNIMQAFAKGASAGKPKKIEPTPPAKKAEEGDIDMDMSDDGGDDGGDEDVLPKAQEVAGGKSRQQRQEELRKMMEEDDDEDDAEDDRNKEDEREDSPMEDVVEEKPPKNDGPSEVITASSGDGRRRGKRRIMRKKMIEDKDGYLVTIQEEGWESFSEDEAPSSKVSAVATPASSAPSSAPKQKLSASKKGQGNIMSFFAKK
ncbi:CDC27 protein [Sporothrix epigloea]|uniref:CDC27 protein n=1 Tax=Sporothrix epigloea TaxID=1892477 RepID=A0ABP0E4H6_9PEZI